MSLHLRRSSLVVVALVALVVLSGCSAVTGLGDDSTSELPSAEEAVEGYRSFDTMRATATTTATEGNATDAEQTMVQRARIVQRPSTGESWSETLAPENRSGDLVVSNDTATWTYDVSENSATRINSSTFDTAEDSHPEYLRRLLDAVADDGSSSESVGVSPLPVVPGTPAPRRAAAGTMGQQQVEYNGTATVDGRTAHVFHLTPRTTDEESIVLDQTVYLDADHFVPLRQQMTYRLDGNVTQYDIVYRNVTFDPDVADGKFEFDPPEGTNVSETALPTSTTYESVDALRANVSMSVDEPTLPDGFTLRETRHTVSTEQHYSRVALTYENGTGMLSVTMHNTTDIYTGTAEGENVSVGSATATYREFGSVNSVQWACEGSYYAVSSNVLSEGAVLDIARSLACEAPARADGTSGTDGPDATEGTD